MAFDFDRYFNPTVKAPCVWSWTSDSVTHPVTVEQLIADMRRLAAENPAYMKNGIQYSGAAVVITTPSRRPLVVDCRDIRSEEDLNDLKALR